MIVIVAGVSGSGKTTIGALLAGRLAWHFADADAFHTAANIAKMRAGIPLTDADRWPWLHAIGAWMDERIAAGESAVVTCSALKRAYREVLLDGRPQARMIFLAVSQEEADRRLAARHGHFFPERLVGSQFEALEPPSPQESRVTVVPSGHDPGETVAAIIAIVRRGEGGDDEAEARPARDLQPRAGHRPRVAGDYRRGGGQEGTAGRDHPGQGFRSAQEARAAFPRAEGDQGEVPPGGEGLEELRPTVCALPLVTLTRASVSNG
jgi:gluconokinase